VLCDRRHRRGYVLVVTLGLLVLATTLLVAVGRTAMQHALAARLASDELQRRWGAESCRVAILPFAESILVNAEARRGMVTPVFRADVRLGDSTFQLIVSDEQAKASVNAIYDNTDKSTTEERIRESLSGSGLGNTIHLYPAQLIDLPPSTQPASQPSGVAQPDIRQYVSGFGQIFQGIPPERLMQGGAAAPIEVLTCWGNGAINVMRASENSLRLATTPQLTKIEITRLIDARNAELFPQTKRLAAPIAMPGQQPVNLANLDTASRLLAEARIQVKDRARLGLAGGSMCHSLWVVVQDGRRTWYKFLVFDESDAAHRQIQSYVW
jgi:Tfp pilus assembly protein PilX